MNRTRSIEMDGPSSVRDAGRERYFDRADRAVWVAAALLVLVVVIALLVPTEPLAIDQAWSEAMQDIQTPRLRHAALVFDALGRPVGVALLLVAVGVVLLRARRWRALVLFATVEALAPLSSAFLKALTGRARPPEGVVHPHGTSFPSGHTTYAAAISVALVLLFTRPGPRRRKWWLLAGLGTVAMAWSRTYLQVHWLSDVIGGALLGLGIALLVFGVAQTHPVSRGGSHGRRRRGHRAQRESATE